MKKSFLKILFIASSVFLVSCTEDLLEPYNPGSLTEEQALTTVADLRLLLNSGYANINSRSESESVSIFTDEVGIGYANGGQGLSAEWVFQMVPNSALPTAIWGQSYAALARINRVIEYGDKIPGSTPAEIEERKRVLGEAYALRAYINLRLLAYFSPNMKDNSALAAILATRAYSSDEPGQQRSTNGEFYNLIFSDTDKSLDLYNSLITPGTVDKTLANRIFTMGIKARAYAYRGDYTNAELWANNTIAAGGATLATPAQYRNMFFTDTDTTEVIFKLKRNAVANAQGYNLHNAWCAVRPNYAGSPYYEVGRSLYNIIAATTADARFRTLVAPSSVIDPNYATSSDYRNSDVIIINKHGGVATGTTTAATATANTFNNDIKIMRMSEMYLIKAEARANAGDLAGVATNIDIVRDARFGSNQTAPVYATIQSAWAGILLERRLEFAFEGYRFLDLKRLATLAGVGIDRNPADYTSSSANFPAANPVNLPMTSYKWALPIPQIETNANSVITQNLGY